MMTATENMVARLEAEKAEPVPAPAPTPKPDLPTAAAPKPEPAKPTSAPANHTSAARYSVTLTLDPHVHKYYSKKADEDDRSLAKYLQRFLRTTCPPAPGEKDEKF